MLIRLFCRVKTLLITTSKYIVEIRLQTIEIKKPTGFLISVRLKKEFLRVQEISPARPPAPCLTFFHGYLCKC